MGNVNVRWLAAAAGICFAGAATARPVEVIYSRASSSPSSNVPGAVDPTGAAVSTKFNTVPEFWLSPDGTTWLLRATTTQATTEDSVMLLGQGVTGTVVLQEFRPFPGAVGNETVDFFSSSMSYPFNANNDWAISLRSKGGVASVFNKLVRYTGGVGALRFQMGDLYTGMTDTTTSGDETIGNSTVGIHLLNDGRIGWCDVNPGNLSSTRYPVTAYDKVKHLQSRLDLVQKIDGSGTIMVTGIASVGSLNNIWASPDGSRTVVRIRADEDGNQNSSPTDPYAISVDGQVKAQESKPLPGDATLTVTAINNISVAANNDWFMRGTTATGAWLVRNGTVIAKSGDPIGGDAWGTGTFYSMAGNSNGDYVMTGKTTNPDTARDDVLVINGQVVLREGDAIPIDLDGDGNANESAYIGNATVTTAAFTANNAIGIAPDKTVYVLVSLRDSATGGANLSPSGTPTALIKITPATPTNDNCCRGTTCNPVAAGTCTGSVAGSASLVVSSCGAGGSFASCCYADFNHDGIQSIDDLFLYFNAYFTSSPYANVGGDGVATPTIDDLFLYINAYFGTCS